MNAFRFWGVGLLCVGAATTGHAADSVSRNTTCLQGDAVSPWADGAGAIGSEQCDAYVVDLAEFQSSWGTTFGIAPLVKTSKQSPGFFSSLISAQALSRRQKVDVPFAAGDYDLWTAPGFGVNNDPSLNDPGATVSVVGRTGVQFGAAFAEFSGSYNGVIGALVNIDPAEPKRLYVKRVQAANNSCNSTSNIAQFGLGSVDEDGNIHFRADGFGAAAGCGLASLVNNNLFRARMQDRDCSVLNVISNAITAGAPGGPFGNDAAALVGADWFVRNQISSLNHNPPGLMPESIVGGSSLLLGTNFGDQYVRGPAFGAISSDSSHFAPGISGQRGNLSYSGSLCAVLNNSHGIAAILAKSTSGNTDTMNVWGLDASGNVTGRIALTLPPQITDPVADPVTGANHTNLDFGPNQFDHYHSQVAFRGGNGQIAMGVDQAGRLIVAAEVDHPEDFGPNWPFNYLAVARVDCASGAVEWSMAGYAGLTLGYNGDSKPVLDGPSGNVIGRMTSLDLVTGGAPLGPSISAPMIDAVGNIYFLSSLELFDSVDPENGPVTYNSGLIRAVYNPSTFGYELELLFKLGDTFRGANSNIEYLISFMAIADNDSVSSGTAWSQNISEVAHLSIDVADLDPSDPRTLGGLVIGAEIIYDADGLTGDGDFEKCATNGGEDQDYNVLLYVGSVEALSALQPPAAAPAPFDGPKNRYISFAPNSGAGTVAFRLDKTSAPTGSGWVGTPGAEGLAPVVGAPVFRVWSESVVHAGDCEIVPVATYEIRATADGATFSAPLAVNTINQPSGGKFWGDTVGAFDGVQWTSPNGIVNANDFLAALQKFQFLPTAPHVSIVDVQSVSAIDPCLNRLTNIADVFILLQAFQGNLYPFTTDPALCPVCP